MSNASTAQSSRSERRAARAEAAAWIVRLHGPHRSPTLESAFRHWLAAHPENARQFERVTEVWDTAPTVSHGGLTRMMFRQKTPVGFAGVLARAAMVLLFVGAVAFGAYRLWWNASYTTGIGEQRVMRLDDGSRVSLNAGTQVQIVYSGSERLVRLKQGEAFFEVAPDPARPFAVVVGERKVTALGTSFVVRYEPHRTAVTLVEGKVAVASKSASPANPHRILAPGERLIFEKDATPKVDSPRMDMVIAWRRGEVMLDNTRLADAVAEMNRYDEAELVLDDPSIAGLKVGGIYHTGDSEGFARTIARLHQLEVTKRSGRIHLKPEATLQP